MIGRVSKVPFSVFSCATLALATVLLVNAVPARAHKQQFLDFIHSQGVPPSYFGTAGADYSNVKTAEMICDVFHNGGGPQDTPFLGMQQNSYRDVLIDGARRFMCPGTQH
jgi:hypothetical protein